MAPPTSPTPVYDAVVEEKTADELRDVIVECSGGSGRVTRHQAQQQQEERSAAAKAAVNTPGGRRGARKELPLAAARRLGLGDLVCVLVEHGADVAPVFGSGATSIGVCIAYGDAADSVRALVRSGEHDADEPIGYDPVYREFADSGSFTCTAVHLCIAPPFISSSHDLRPRLRSLEVLAREGGANIDALAFGGMTPLALLVSAESDHMRALRTLLRLGADPNGARSTSNRRGGPRGPPLMPPAMAWLRFDSPGGAFPIKPCLRALVAAGARVSGGVFDTEGNTPLMIAAHRSNVPALQLLLDEMGAAEDVDVPNRKTGALPLTCCGMVGSVVGLLLRAGADPNKKDRAGNLPLLQALRKGAQPETHPSAALAMLKAGAAVAGVKAPGGETPLILACERWPTWIISDNRIALLNELLKRTPVEERRATRNSDGSSAIDLIAGAGLGGGDGAFAIEQPAGWDDDAESDEEAEEARMDAYIDAAMERTFEANRRFVAQLRIDGVSVLPENEEMVQGVVASHALPMLARRMRALEAEMAVRRSESRRWRAHDDIVGMAFDFLELREAEEGVRRREARVAELEGEVGEGGAGEEESGGDGDGDGMEEDE